MNRTVKYYSFILGLIVLFAGACTQAAKVEVSDTDCINDSMLANIEIDTVKQSIVNHELKMTGKVSFDQEHTQKIFPLASGRVVEVKAELGDYVKKGDVLAVVSSSEAADFESQISAAESRLVIAEKNLNVAKDMYEDGLTSQKEYTTAQKEYQIAQSEVLKVKEVLKIYNISGASTYTVRSSISGFVVEKKITPDFYIRADNNDNIFTISDISNVWILVNLYEVDLEKVKVGYEADVKTLSYDKVYPGTVDKIFNVVDPQTHTLKARVKLHNADFSLKPEMFANVSIYYHEHEQLPSVPSNAIIFNNNRNYVMVYKDKCHIETREVVKADDFRDITYIRSGLKPGEKIISKLQLLVYNQLNN
jgi:cobalt-zinc-cadmium efflux system membrane fusion protein